ncbi:MAG: pilus assembly protein PilX [Clostridiales bacterium]|nr:pilus assembly protein PilX [Clostridiales bacterium]
MIVSHLLILVFVIHAILGIFNLTGVASVVYKGINYLLLALVAVHVVIGTILTVKTDVAQNKAGVRYQKENQLFWIRRTSGFTTMVLIVFHILAFTGVNDTNHTLPLFNIWRLITQILMVLSLGVHLATNMKNLFIGTGVKKPAVRAGDVLFWTSIILLLSTIAFIIYYIRWQTL